ncbi:serine-rich adhesin for platelets-like [Uranotaenia lowii]|uniref:serine-rich adhesin for platelets-like n=1 Tax=Uranotaenia lowii TaxID=190385 RepID=UPI0024787078|nr:serine-rich adhesin for platelets-like [Uranotaenia lowii]
MLVWSNGPKRRRRRRRLEQLGASTIGLPGLGHLTKWCTTLFIILESTNVGGGLLITASTTTLPSSSSRSSSSLSAVSSSSVDQNDTGSFSITPTSSTPTAGQGNISRSNGGGLEETSSSSSISGSRQTSVAPTWATTLEPGSSLNPESVKAGGTMASAVSSSLLAHPLLPHFEALVQQLEPQHGGLGGSDDTDNGHHPSSPTAASIPTGADDPLFLLGGFRFPAHLNPPEDLLSPLMAAPASSSSLGERTSPLVVAPQQPKSSLVNLNLVSSSSSLSGSISGSKLKSASLSVGNTSGGGKTVGPKKSLGSGSAGPLESEPASAVNRIDSPGAGGGDFREFGEGNFSKMYFETENLTTISAQVGSITVLPCVVRNIGEGVVSWIRRKDYHLLTIGVTTYSSDERFNIIRSEDSEEWPLQIKYVQLRDAGPYECQVSTHPPTSIFVQLDVVEAKAEIFGPSEKYLKPGSTLRLTCRVVQSNEPPLYIFWYHNNRMINYDVHRGVNVSTESDNRFSELVITHTNTLNSGNYSCVSNNAVAASTLVHILNGENPAAMQHGDHGRGVLLEPVHIQLLLTALTYQVINSLLCAH